MSYEYQVIANSSYGSGVLVSLIGGKRKEEFLNENDRWYYAKEMIVSGSVNEIELKMPGLGNLWIYQVDSEESDESDEGVLVATFPKGTWEFVRLLT